jgi:16S rRNA (guanine966-N2)-methyltransferase
MRIVGGRLKGRLLKGPGSNKVRPTSDRLRETIFNILAHAYGNPAEGARVIDLFAGTGAMGLEALSRGAEFVLFVERAADACRIIRANLQALGADNAARLRQGDACKLGMAEGEACNLAFLDPPYGRGFVVPALNALRDGCWLAKDNLVVIEEQARPQIELPGGYAFLARRTYGETHIVFARAV